MSPHSIHAPLNDLTASILTAGTSLGHAAVALFHLILAVGLFGIDKFVQLAQTCIQLGFDLFRGVAGFVVGMSIEQSLEGPEGGSTEMLTHYSSQLISSYC